MTIAAPTKALSVHAGIDEYTTAGTLEKFAVATPRLYRADGTVPAVLCAHGFGADGPSSLTGWSGAPNIVGFNMRLADAGYLVLAGDFGGPGAWGNPVCMQRMEAARLWIQGPPYYAKPGKVVLIGGSMGALSVVNYWRYAPGGGNAAGANASCVVTCIPFTAAEEARSFTATRDSINAAWSLTLGSSPVYPTQANGPAWSAATTYSVWQYVTRLGSVYRCIVPNTNFAPESNHTGVSAKWELVPASTSLAVMPTGPGLGDPHAHLSEFATMPYLSAISALDDASVDPAMVTQFANATLTKESHTTIGFGGHSDATVGQADMANVVAFVSRYAPLPTGGYF